MNSFCRLLFPVLLSVVLPMFFGVVSCRKKGGEEGSGVPAKVVPELKANQISDLPGAVFQAQAGSAIAWQPWTRETFERARDAKRLLLVVIAMPQQPAFQEVLAEIAADPVLMAEIERSYVPVLVDGDGAREVGLLTADLCAEIKRPLSLPLLVWMTHEANPVAWIPLSGDSVRIREVFDQSHSMVSRMAADNPDYVLENSARDQAARRERVAARRNEKMASKEPAEHVLRCVRQLTSLYDPVSRTFDEAGGLFPAGSIELLASAAMNPAVPEELRVRARETTEEMMVDLLPSAMFDPLDGGLYSSRRGISWAIPGFTRDCVGQARAVVALIRAYEMTGDPLILERALGVLRFAEREYEVGEGLYSIGFRPRTKLDLWLWSVEEVEQLLSAEDAAWWIKATQMRGLGNLPSEADPLREYFRRNSLGLSKTVPDLCKELGIPVERFEAVRKTLLKARDARMGDVPRDETAHAGATFRMISAFAAAYAATGDEAWRGKAVALLGKAREAFSQGSKLRMYDREGPASVTAGRAFLYALALQSILDVHDIQPSESLLSWADDVATTAAERFTDADFLKECPDEAKIIDLPVTDLAMLFDDSTAGLISSAESRMAALGRPLVASFSRLATPLPEFAVERPVLHTDLILATMMRHHGMKAICGGNPSAELKAAYTRLPIRLVLRREAEEKDDVPAGSVLLMSGEAVLKTVSSPEELEDGFLPSVSDP